MLTFKVQARNAGVGMYVCMYMPGGDMYIYKYVCMYLIHTFTVSEESIENHVSVFALLMELPQQTRR